MRSKEITPTRKGVIDQVEGNLAVIEWLDNGERIDLPCRELPEEAQVGDVLHWDGTTWKVIGRNGTEKERDWKVDGGVVGRLTGVIQRIRKSWLFFLFVLLLGCGTSPVAGPVEGELKVYFLDVGQGDATLVQFPSGKWMLIDGGERHQGEKVVTMLQEAGVKEIDILVATHPDSDHIGGLPQVLQSFPVKSVYAPKVGHTTKTYQDFLLAVREQGLKIKTAQGE